jgi:hypothetical protein
MINLLPREEKFYDEIEQLGTSAAAFQPLTRSVEASRASARHVAHTPFDGNGVIESSGLGY